MIPSTEQQVKKTKGVTLKVLILVVLFLLTLFIFWVITGEIVLEHEGWLDNLVFSKLAMITSAGLTKVMLVFTFFGSTIFLLPCYILLTLYFFFFRKNNAFTLNVIAIGLSSTGLLFVFKDIFKRHRPLDPLVPDVTGFSFPSGHSFSAFTFCGLLIYILWCTHTSRSFKWILSIVLSLFAMAIALSRVYLHVHFASDVIAGFCLSMLWLMISLWVLDQVDKRYFRKIIA